MKRFCGAVLLLCMLFCIDCGSVRAAEDGDGPQVVAHRGYSAIYPENTLLSFYEAVENGATMVELDVRRTSDGKLVVYHDNDLSRVMGQETDFGVADLTYKEVRKLDAGSFLSEEYIGLKIPSFAEALAFLQQYDVQIVVELKPIADDKGFVRQTYNMVKKYDMLDRVCFASFSSKYLRQIKKLNYLQPTMKFDNKGQVDLVKKCPADYYGVNEYVLTKELVDIIHAAGSQVFAYTSVNMDEVTAMESLGVDGVIINFPTIAAMESSEDGVASGPVEDVRDCSGR